MKYMYYVYISLVRVIFFFYFIFWQFRQSLVEYCQSASQPAKLDSSEKKKFIGSINEQIFVSVLTLYVRNEYIILQRCHLSLCSIDYNCCWFFLAIKMWVILVWIFYSLTLIWIALLINMDCAENENISSFM